MDGIRRNRERTRTPRGAQGTRAAAVGFRLRALVVGLVGLGLHGLAAEPAPPRLCIEYLPGIVYDDQPLVVCARVEAEAPLPVRLAASLREAEGKVLASDSAQGTPKPGAPWRHQSTLRVPRGAPAALDVVLTKANGADELGKVTLRVLDGRQALPPLRAQGMRLVDEAGKRVAVRIEQRLRKPEQRWPLVRWLRRKLYGDRIAFDRVLLLGDDLGAPDDGYLKRFGGAKPPYAVSVVAVPGDARPPSPPILRALAAFSRAAMDPPPRLAVLCLGHRDADSGTDVVQFAHALELILQQLERRGCTQFVLVAPLGPTHLHKRLAPYIATAQRVAATYRARLVHPRLTDAHWAGKPDDGRLLLRHPNPIGHQALADTLTRFVARMRR